MPLKTSHHVFLFVLLAVCGVISDAQYAPKPDPIFETIQAIDARLVSAYSQCDLSSLVSKVSDDLNSNDDQTGQTGQAIEQTPSLATIEQNISTRVQQALQPKALQVCPMKDMAQ